MAIKIIKLKPNAVIPTYQTAGAAGLDIHACLDAPKTLAPMERANIPSGLAVELPPGTELQIRARSGLSIKNGITMVNGIGTVDCDYRGEIGVLLINLGSEPFVIEPGMRIAQMVLARYEKVVWQETNSLQSSERGDGGYGSTGVHEAAPNIDTNL
jgi:dUTP pyrophosphatase